MRVLHLPTSIGNHAWHLARAERELGLDSLALAARSGREGFRADIELHLETCNTGVGKFWRSARAFLDLRRRFDVFHFNFGSSLLHHPAQGMNQLELPWYPRGAKLFATYNGCDARQKFPTMQRRTVAACHNPLCYGGMCNSGQLDEQRRRGIEKMARHATHLWAVNPDLLHFLPAEKSSFLPYAIGPTEHEPRLPSLDGPLKIVHAPTNRQAKGSDQIIAAVQRVQSRFPGRVEFQLVEGLPHAEALGLYREADLVIDQLLIGWYGGLAVECMWLGKAVISRIEEADLSFVDAQMVDELARALISAGPEDIESAIVRCVEDRVLVRRIAAAGLCYARRWHDPASVARLTTARYQAALAADEGAEPGSRSAA